MSEGYFYKILPNSLTFVGRMVEKHKKLNRFFDIKINFKQFYYFERERERASYNLHNSVLNIKIVAVLWEIFYNDKKYFCAIICRLYCRK